MNPFKDRIPLPPPSAQKTNMTCHFCIVGCGYKVFKWPANQEGGRAPAENALNLDFTRQLAPLQVTLTPAMVNTIKDNDGNAYNVMILPDKDCVVNQGLSSTRGGQMASILYAENSPVGQQRLKYPMLYSGRDWSESNWQQSLDLYAGLTQRILDNDGADQLFFNVFDHGGAGGGFENTWATGKLLFTGLGTKMVRIHNRPAYNSECHATRDMGISELNNSYEDAELADVLISIGNNPYECQTNYFLAHWLPNLQGGTLAKKQSRFPDESFEKTRIIYVDPRRTASVAVSETAAGKDSVLHLAINPGTDTALFNGLLTYVIAQGWIDKEFIAQHTNAFQATADANALGLEECSQITGVAQSDLIKAAEWAYKPKASGHLPRSMHAYEKGVIWGNDNYRTQTSIVNLALATHNVGRRGTGVVRMGGHQEGYARPPYPGGRPAPYIDQEVINGKGMMLTVWACNAFQTTVNADAYREAVAKRADIVNQAMASARGATTEELIDVIYDAVKNKGGLFLTTIDLYKTKFAAASHMALPAAHPGEMNLTSMNGERRLRLSEKFMDPPGIAKPDCMIAAEIAKHLKQRYMKAGNTTMAERFAGFDWKNEEDAFNDGFRSAHEKEMDSQGGPTGHLATYALLRDAGTNGVQLPIQAYRDAKLIGTEMLYTDNKFDTKDGKALFQASPWNKLPDVVEAQKQKYPFWINNGRTNQIWQTAYHDQHLVFRKGRFPMAPIEMHPDDAKSLGVEAGDIVEVFNNYGASYAMVYPEPSIKRGQVFMLFGYPNGIQGDVVSEWTDRNVIPYYKGAWANIRKIGENEEYKRTVSFKSRRYS
ncbi:arsenate reductase (azurin) large subunit [Pseudomonas fluorescens]|uniref:Arsenate reductase (Azurin) large subunit n=1 Tax=Pseudomonas fluorescens TaxID=294 RepID=A0A944HD99_PSEFL|nr:arsenate reductase (azurin) large subunit [Pseudomonas fluorescens]MBT2297607.1 arsenate reductase (azurin) large subunit [Pseudomonas fluorescens]MBT2305805.1 arsenate reductase (azurin) large subunit [Pseudomonas fluorescens]MBT2314172.1 arsenate reductase (azurin) large subunit [Pseudomonas fluorescens]MBT2319336.1 arsenate reductase (azurin) large subunit [Pseudomonas fluorescens]MBT2329247.1 arsenate reductase (azurin) large subunit [Pseudomonas fluorescens]